MARGAGRRAVPRRHAVAPRAEAGPTASRRTEIRSFYFVWKRSRFVGVTGFQSVWRETEIYATAECNTWPGMMSCERTIAYVREEKRRLA